MKLDAMKFGLAFGIIYALIFFVYALAAALFGVGGEMIKLIGSLYLGVSASFLGAIAGAIWGFAVGFVFFWLGAEIYNRLLARAQSE